MEKKDIIDECFDNIDKLCENQKELKVRSEALNSTC